MPHSLKKITVKQYQDWFKPRPRDAHKGLYGHVLVIGGDKGMPGAPQIAARAAARMGAGLVTIATRSEYAVHANVIQPEIMCFAIKNKKDLQKLLEKATVIVLGPGLGQSSWSKMIFKTVLKSQLPMVLDADALNLLAQFPHSQEQWVLTPHVGEAARLLQITVQEVQDNREQTVQLIQSKYGGVCVLKGMHTLIANEQGARSVCEAGNPGMASGGMGDLLSGIIGSLIAQRFPLSVASECGVCIHAEAGDLAAQQGERGLLATDLLPFLRELINKR